MLPRVDWEQRFAAQLDPGVIAIRDRAQGLLLL